MSHNDTTKMMREAIHALPHHILVAQLAAALLDHPRLTPEQIETLGDAISRSGHMAARNRHK